MKCRTYFLLYLTLLIGFNKLLRAQSAKEFRLTGRILDQRNATPLPGANILIVNQAKGSSSDANGYFSILLHQSKVIITVSFIGYRNYTDTLQITQEQNLEIKLVPEAAKLEEIVIEQSGSKSRFEANQMSLEELSIEDLRKIPVIFGELDLIKALQLKPGISSGGEAASGLYVRGGGPDQNLVLLDDNLIYNPSHLFGFFSVFNADAVSRVKLYKGGFPAKFGGRLSSVLEVEVPNPKPEKFSAKGGIGLIASRLSVETPIVKDKISLLLAGRRTYFDIFTEGINQLNANDPEYDPIPRYHFYDLNAKLNYNLSPKDKLSFNAYTGRDVFQFDNQGFSFDFTWGNTAAALQWEHRFSEELLLKLQSGYTAYEYDINNRFDIFNFNIGAAIQDYQFKADMSYSPNTQHFWEFGFALNHQDFQVGRLRANSDDGSIDFSQDTPLNAQSWAAYLSDEISFGEDFLLSLGLRYSGFYAQQSDYHGLEPRLSARYQISARQALKLSLSRVYQYVHLLSNSGASLPTDVWYPSGQIVPPQRADQVALGFNQIFGDAQWLFSTEAFYKVMQNQLDLRDGAELFASNNLDAELVFGRGWSYGTEWYIEKTKGKLQGWLGYTLSWTWRQFGESNGNPAINNGEPFFPRYDRRHDISLVLNYQLSERLTLSASWVYATGNAFTLAAGRFYFQGLSGDNLSVVPDVTERNGLRLPAYHRMDWGLIWQLNPKWGSADLTFSIYNVYNRRNAYFAYLETLEDNTGTPQGFRGRQVALFPIIPAITYNFKF